METEITGEKVFCDFSEELIDLTVVIREKNTGLDSLRHTFYNYSFGW